jgi:uncharacterized protein YceK
MIYVILILLLLLLSGCSTIQCRPEVKVRYEQLETVIISIAEEKEIGMVDYMETLTPSVYCTF